MHRSGTHAAWGLSENQGLIDTLRLWAYQEETDEFLAEHVENAWLEQEGKRLDQRHHETQQPIYSRHKWKCIASRESTSHAVGKLSIHKRTKRHLADKIKRVRDWNKPPSTECSINTGTKNSHQKGSRRLQVLTNFEGNEWYLFENLFEKIRQREEWWANTNLVFPTYREQTTSHQSYRNNDCIEISCRGHIGMVVALSLNPTLLFTGSILQSVKEKSPHKMMDNLVFWNLVSLA